MTTRQFIGVLLRRWYVVVGCLLLTVAGLNLAQGVRGVYWTEVDIVFLAPNSANALEYQSESLVHFAAVIEREFNGSTDPARVASTSVTLYGTGVSRGHQVTLPNQGGQWSTNFNRPVLAVEVVDSSPERVDEVRAGIMSRIDDLVYREQAKLGIAPSDSITTLPSPAQAVVRYAAGNPLRAQVAIGLLGVGVAVAASLLVESGVARVRRHGRRGSRAGEPGRA